MAGRRRFGLPSLATRVFESVGVLNLGTAKLAAGAADAAEGTPAAEAPIKATALNVTRVTGVGALIASAGAAALALFSVDKAKDDVAIVVAAYASTGFVVGAALIAVALIVSADLRARATSATPTTAAAAAPADGEATTKPATTKPATSGTPGTRRSICSRRSRRTCRRGAPDRTTRRSGFGPTAPEARRTTSFRPRISWHRAPASMPDGIESSPSSKR